MLFAQQAVTLSLPALIVRQDPTRPPKIWTPFGVPQPQILPKYASILQLRKKTDRHLVWMIPLAYLIAWSLDLIIYFAIPPSEPQ